MPVYTPHGPFVNGSSPGIDQSFLNAVENQLVATEYGINILASPYLLVNNVTINSGVTNTYTATGGATGVTSGSKAVLAHLWMNVSAIGTVAKITPHSTAWSVGLYPAFGSGYSTSQAIAADVIIPVDVNGQIDVLASGGNLVGLFLGLYGFIY